MNRNKALEILHEYVQSESLRKHCYAVEAAMRSYATTYGEDPETWGMVGLLHDFDYEKYPNEHPFWGARFLKEEDYSEEIIEAILGHATYSGTPRISPMAKCLFAVDELCGFIIACALVRPEKLKGLTPSSVKKRLKMKAFAAKVSREDITLGIQELDIDEDKHIARVIEA
ncbi:MAG: HD domain-containing protein, partial [bacterium]|nr:HD domain-containing protein [bacterium]